MSGIPAKYNTETFRAKSEPALGLIAADEEQVRLRAEWLSKHGAPIDWIILTRGEVDILRRELIHLNTKLSAAKQLLQQAGNIFTLK